MKSSMLVCQISDLHIRLPGELSRRVVDCAALLEQCVEAILRLPQRPDVVVATGDLVDGGDIDEYAHVRRLLAPLAMPVYLIPGNRDDRAAMRSAFSDHDYLQHGSFVQYAVDDWPVRIVALDTLTPTESGGRLCPERLAWLDRTLASKPDKPTLLIMHHPPFPTFIGSTPRFGFEGGEALAQIVARNPQIERVLCGHVHRSVTFRFAGTIASICPSTAHQTTLNLASDASPTFTLEPAGFQLHAWKQGVGVVSHTACIGDYAGPYPFR